jgi:hypothetical protein
LTFERLGRGLQPLEHALIIATLVHGAQRKAFAERIQRVLQRQQAIEERVETRADLAPPHVALPRGGCCCRRPAGSRMRFPGARDRRHGRQRFARHGYGRFRRSLFRDPLVREPLFSSAAPSGTRKHLFIGSEPTA